jgi:cytochrome c5
MYSQILLAHRIIVSLFLLHYVIKLVLLLLDKEEALTSYTKATRIAEMIISTAFLVSGGWLMLSGAVFGNFTIVKLIFVFASIPIAVIGFKRKKKLLAVLSVVLLLLAYGLAEMNKKAKAGGKIDTSAAAGNPVEIGKIVYQTSCTKCHGEDGKLAASGAKDLSVTQLTIADQKSLIKSGKNAMPAYTNLTEEQLDGVVQYITSLKK